MYQQSYLFYVVDRLTCMFRTRKGEPVKWLFIVANACSVLDGTSVSNLHERRPGLHQLTHAITEVHESFRGLLT